MPVRRQNGRQPRPDGFPQAKQLTPNKNINRTSLLFCSVVVSAVQTALRRKFGVRPAFWGKTARQPANRLDEEDWKKKEN